MVDVGEVGAAQLFAVGVEKPRLHLRARAGLQLHGLRRTNREQSASTFGFRIGKAFRALLDIDPQLLRFMFDQFGKQVARVIAAAIVNAHDNEQQNDGSGKPSAKSSWVQGHVLTILKEKAKGRPQAPRGHNL